MSDNLTTEDKAQVYSAAVIEALAAAGEATGGPDINAAIGALSFAQAYLIAKIDNRFLRKVAIERANAALAPMVQILRDEADLRNEEFGRE